MSERGPKKESGEGGKKENEEGGVGEKSRRMREAEMKRRTAKSSPPVRVTDFPAVTRPDVGVTVKSDAALSVALNSNSMGTWHVITNVRLYVRPGAQRPKSMRRGSCVPIATG